MVPFVLVGLPDPGDSTTTTVPEVSTSTTGPYVYGLDPASDAAVNGWPVLIFLVAVLVTFTVAR